MRVHFLGVRGSTPAPGVDFLRYGGNTSSVAISRDGAVPDLLLDAGTGARRLASIMAGQPFRGAVLLTHLHWDHTHGLPFSAALDHPDAVVDVFMPAQGIESVAALARSMSPPSFPITPAQLRGHWTFNALDEGDHDIGGFTVGAREVPHKGGSTFGYRVADETAVVAYLPDHGPTALGPGPDGLGARHPAALALTACADLLIHDAQYTATELPSRAGFGHSAIDYAVALGREAGVGCVALFHHDPDRTDDELDFEARRFSGEVSPTVVVAREGLSLEL
ncbi:MAG: MBL fold metallo-hydrolase [Aquihabitans sp.]